MPEADAKPTKSGVMAALAKAVADAADLKMLDALPQLLKTFITTLEEVPAAPAEAPAPPAAPPAVPARSVDLSPTLLRALGTSEQASGK
jgi:hypothetical protein